MNIQVDQCLIGSKHAILLAPSTLLVSPAMWELMRNATPDELERLLQAIEVRRGPDLRLLTSDFRLPLITSPSAPPGRAGL